MDPSKYLDEIFNSQPPQQRNRQEPTPDFEQIWSTQLPQALKVTKPQQFMGFNGFACANNAADCSDIQPHPTTFSSQQNGTWDEPKLSGIEDLQSFVSNNLNDLKRRHFDLIHPIPQVQAAKVKKGNCELVLPPIHQPNGDLEIKSPSLIQSADSISPKSIVFSKSSTTTDTSFNLPNFGNNYYLSCNNLQINLTNQAGTSNYRKPGFECSLTSTCAPVINETETPIPYLNKGQSYILVVNRIDESTPPSPYYNVQLTIVANANSSNYQQYNSWTKWYTKQSYDQRQRALNIYDTYSTVMGTIEELAYNSVRFCWNALRSNLRIDFAVNCLGNDFCGNKTSRIPSLQLQLDIFDVSRGSSCIPIFRSAMGVRVFSDKGAERKWRDENRKLKLRFKAYADGPQTEPVKTVKFENITGSNYGAPVLFVPRQVCENLYEIIGHDLERNNDFMQNFRAKYARKRPRRLTLQVRTDQAKSFEQIRLQDATVDKLKIALSKKFDVKISSLFLHELQPPPGMLVELRNEHLTKEFPKGKLAFDVTAQPNTSTGNHVVILSNATNAEKS